MDEESEDEDGDTSTPGVAMPRRDGKQMDLLLEMESLEPQQLMSVKGAYFASRCGSVWQLR